MLVLTVTSNLVNHPPPLSFDPLNDVTNLHPVGLRRRPELLARPRATGLSLALEISIQKIECGLIGDRLDLD